MLEIITLVILVVAGGVAIAANIGLRDPVMHLTVILMMLAFNALYALQGLLLLVPGLVEPDSIENEEIGALVYVVTAGLATLILLGPVRKALVPLFPRRHASDETSDMDEEAYLLQAAFPILSDGEAIRMPPSVPPPKSAPASNELLGYDPRNTVHMVALILCIYMVGSPLANFVLGGGLSGLAEDSEVTLGALVTNLLIFALVPLAGIGLFVRRNWSEAMQRLGLGKPSLLSIGAGIGAAIVMYGFVVVASLVWVILVGVDTFEEQSEAAEAIADQVDTIWLALAVAASAAIGEEIAFRGALQPVLGLWWTAILFTLVHFQYTLTPASIIIFGVAIVLGLVRRHFNLYAAILAHFLYNFMILAPTVLFS